MPALSIQLVKEFCKLCNWAYEVWLNHRCLFDDNPLAKELQQSLAAEALYRLHAISHEYCLLQVTKLHDNAVVSGEVTLGIDYIIKYGGWEPSTLNRLKELSKNLDNFAKNLRKVRNKLLSHNDLAAVLSGGSLGEFEEGHDIQYFSELQNFVNLIHDEVVGGPFPFNNLVENDVVALMSIIRP